MLYGRFTVPDPKLPSTTTVANGGEGGEVTIARQSPEIETAS
jgi:hypothetical protein